MIASAIYLDVHDEPSRRQPPAAVRKPESQKAELCLLPAFLPVDYVTNDACSPIDAEDINGLVTEDNSVGVDICGRGGHGWTAGWLACFTHCQRMSELNPSLPHKATLLLTNATEGRVVDRYRVYKLLARANWTHAPKSLACMAD
ncbi:hypothetical protein THAOC_32457 [Thalassiosira oceanica]|uniref:Uncharacterized protein n=1 Tax=Thalassiosira oceanica TaxID=159749 RepID=K0RPX1_THAOC|nr:hypothetical protein THAOC_32457 [Thalassiosira oceanica]|eukprot:EJK48722.1 hypothetical protein THAOC_32457 [Thalassiosira oceanica]